MKFAFLRLNAPLSNTLSESYITEAGFFTISWNKISVIPWILSGRIIGDWVSLYYSLRAPSFERNRHWSSKSELTGTFCRRWKSGRSAAPRPGLDGLRGAEPGWPGDEEPGPSRLFWSSGGQAGKRQGDSWRVRSPLESDLSEAVEESQHRRSDGGPAWGAKTAGVFICKLETFTRLRADASLLSRVVLPVTLLFYL